MTREEMKRLARVCAAKMEPQRMRRTGVVTDLYPHESEYVVTPGLRPRGGALFRRRTDIVPTPYPIIKFDRVSGKIKSIAVATPTAPLRRVR